MMEINRQGCTRIVILTKRFAVKVPNFLSGWRMFLEGILASHQERVYGKTNYSGLCPVLFSLPGGFLIVMRRVRVMSDMEFFGFDYDNFVERGEYMIPAERKANSFGWLDGHPVAIDYGS